MLAFETIVASSHSIFFYKMKDANLGFMKTILFALLVLLCFTTSFAQYTTDVKLGLSLIDDGKAYFYEGDIEKSKQAFEQSLAVFGEIKTRKDSTNYDYMHQQFGDFFKNRAQYLIALDFYQRGIKWVPIIYGNSRTGNYYIGKYNYSQGECYAKMGYPTIAIEYFEKALNNFLIRQEPASIAATYSALATNYEAIKNHQQAAIYFDKALNEYIKIGKERHTGVAVIYNNIGSMEDALQNKDEAIYALELSIEIYEELIAQEPDDIKRALLHKRLATPITNIIGIYIGKQDFDKADYYFDKLLNLDIHKDDFFLILPDYYRNKSLYFEMNGQQDSALSYANKSIDLSLKIFQQKPVEIVRSYVQKSEILFANQQYDQALAMLQQSLIHLVPDFENTDVSVNPQPTSIVNFNFYKILVLKALCWEKKYDLKNDVSYLNLAATIYSQLDVLVDELRKEFTLKTNNIELSKYASDMYHSAVALSYKQWEATQDDNFKHLAYYYASKLKSGALANVLTNLESKKVSGIPEEELELEQQLDIAITFYNNELQIEEVKPDSLQSLSNIIHFQDTLFELSEKRNDLLLHFEKNYPRYIDLKHNSKSIDIPTLQQAISQDDAVIDYTYDDSYIYISVITSQSFNMIAKPINGKAEINKAVTQLMAVINKRNLIQKKLKNQFINQSHALYNYLIAPIEPTIANKQKLYIISEGALHYVPFEVLLKNNHESDFSKMPYLISDFEIIYHYSSYLLVESLNRADKVRELNLLAFAPVFDIEKNRAMPKFVPRTPNASTTALSPLRWSEVEVSYLKNIVQKADGNVTALYRNEANEGVLKNLLLNNTYSHLHISSHGFANTEQPDLSCIVCASTDSSQEDDLLNASEIYNFRLNADLVVLSSCESGIGRLAAGEGMISLTRGFLYAGAENVVYSLWQVSDQYTYELMKRFYDNVFIEEQTYSTALRYAKLDMISSGSVMAQPSYWSSFVLLGK